MTNPFKTGDRVRVISKDYGDDQFGLVGTVNEIVEHDGFDYWVHFDEGPYPENVYMEEDLELIVTTPEEPKAEPVSLRSTIDERMTFAYAFDAPGEQINTCSTLTNEVDFVTLHEVAGAFATFLRSAGYEVETVTIDTGSREFVG